jgi:hypothetical protein
MARNATVTALKPDRAAFYIPQLHTVTRSARARFSVALWALLGRGGWDGSHRVHLAHADLDGSQHQHGLPPRSPDAVSAPTTPAIQGHAL